MVLRSSQVAEGNKMILYTKAFIVLLSFIVASQGLEFRCDFRTDLNWATVGNVYTCWNAQLTVLNSWTSLESVQGDHVSGRSNVDVKALHVQNEPTRLETFPKDIEKFFPNLVFIQWWYGSLKTITPDDFRAFPGLRNLNFGHNKIATLDGDLFKHTPLLIWISFFDNLITSAGEDLLNLNELTYVHFGYNPCIDSWANSTQGIQDLKLELATNCPPLAATNPPSSTPTTTDNPCDLRCTLNEEIDRLVANFMGQSVEIEALKDTNAVQNQEIEVLKDANGELREAINNQNDWIVKIEYRLQQVEYKVSNMLSQP